MKGKFNDEAFIHWSNGNSLGFFVESHFARTQKKYGLNARRASRRITLALI
jgi:hypothetical protein